MPSQAMRVQEDSPLAARVAAFLPRITAAELNKCRHHRAGMPLSSCVHLSNPATGSTSLSETFRSAEELQNITFPNGRTGRRAVVFPTIGGISGIDLMHTHALDVHEAQALMRYNKLPKARCFVISLRDPASRLISAFRDSYLHAERLTVSLGPRKNRTASMMIDRLRRPFDFPQKPLPDPSVPPQDARTKHRPLDAGLQSTRNVSSTALLYANSAGRPSWLHKWHYPGPLGGSMFLVSQLSYLRGLDCSNAKTEVHFLCQERYDEDWKALLAEFGMQSSSLGRSYRHSHRRDGLGKKSPPLLAFAIKRSVLSKADQDFIRHVLYPWDTALHQWACGAGMANGRAPRTVTMAAAGDSKADTYTPRDKADWTFVDARWQSPDR